MASKSSRRASGGALVAGVVVALIAIPEALAFTALAGLPLAAGLWSLFLPPIMYWLLKSRARVSLGLSAPVAVMVAQANDGLATGAALARTSAITLLVAGLFAAAGVLRLGFLARLVSRPILAGLALGAFVVLVSFQLEDLLGITVVGHSALTRFASAARGLGGTQAETLVVAGASVALLILGRRSMGRATAGGLALAGAALLVALSGWAGSGSVQVVGPLDVALPRADWGWLSWSSALELLPVAIAIFVLLAVESIELGRGLVMREGAESFDVDHELVRLSATNVVAALSLTLPIAGSASATAAEPDPPSRRRIFALVPSLCAGVLLLLGHEFRHLPRAAVAVVAISAMATLLRPKVLISIARYDPREFVLGALAFGATVLVGPVVGALMATGASAVSLVRWASDSRMMPMKMRPQELRGHDEVLSLQHQGAVIMLNAEAVVQKILSEVRRSSPTPKKVLLDFSAVPRIDYTAMDALRSLEQHLRRHGIRLVVVGATGATAAAMKRGGLEVRSRTALTKALNEAPVPPGRPLAAPPPV